MLFAFAGSALLNSTPTTSTPSRSKITLAAAHRFSSTSTPGRIRSANLAAAAGFQRDELR